MYQKRISHTNTNYTSHFTRKNISSAGINLFSSGLCLALPSSLRTLYQAARHAAQRFKVVSTALISILYYILHYCVVLDGCLFLFSAPHSLASCWLVLQPIRGSVICGNRRPPNEKRVLMRLLGFLPYLTKAWLAVSCVSARQSSIEGRLLPLLSLE